MKEITLHTGQKTAILSLIMATALMAASTADARPEKGWPPSADKSVESRIDRMTQELELTDTQQEEIQAIMEKARKDQERIRTERRAQIDALLTAEQKTKRDARIQASMDRRLKRMRSRLDLTNDQADKLKAIFEERQANPELNRAQMREQIAAILTEEQQMAFNRRSKDRPRDQGREPPQDRCNCD